MPADGAHTELADWIAAWEAIAVYPRREVPDVEGRIERAVALAALEVPATWARPAAEDWRWDGGPYRRGDRGEPSGPERAIEQEIVGAGAAIAAGRTCLGDAVVAGIAAVPLTRKPKIEADLVLLARDAGGGERIYLAEVKSAANTPWYAAVELVRQLLLFRASAHAGRYFHREGFTSSDSDLPVTGLVVAPAAYYVGGGKREASVEPARTLIAAVSAATQLDVALAVWSPATAAITALA